MAKSFGSKHKHLLQHILQHTPMSWAVFGCAEQPQFRANLSHLTTGFFSWRLWPQRQALLQVGNLFSHFHHTSLMCSICSFYPLLVSPEFFSIWHIYKTKFYQCNWPIFSYALLFVILLYLEVLKYLAFILVLLIKCSATWKFFYSVIANPVTRIFLQWKMLALTPNLQYCDLETLYRVNAME